MPSSRCSRSSRRCSCSTSPPSCSEPTRRDDFGDDAFRTTLELTRPGARSVGRSHPVEPPRRSMTSWADLEAAAPDLAAAGRRLLTRSGIGEGLLATIRPDEPPRIHPVYAEIVDGRLLTFVQPRSAKAKDLEADPRYALHLHVDPAAPDEFLVRGRARPIDDPAVVARGPRGVGVRRHAAIRSTSSRSSTPCSGGARRPRTGRRSTRPGDRPPAERRGQPASAASTARARISRPPARTRRRSPRPGSGRGSPGSGGRPGRPERAAPRPRRRRSGR